MSGPHFQRGDIVRAFITHADGRLGQRHPALIVGDPLANNHGDYILIQITSTLWNGNTDFCLLTTDSEFPQTGLSNSSCFRCHKIFVLEPSRLQHQYGTAGPNTMHEINVRLARALGL